ncbi:MAG TPA: polysaccharide biosynthesis/export family protein [Longimicrobium sp.]|nr:polysaccharide biosynthesis/export family protein [Longimicrobium sp.]
MLAALLCAAPGAAAQPPPGGTEPLRPGDVIRLRIWQEPTLTGEFPVDESGMATLPKLGAMQVADVSPDVLQARLVEAYAQYLQHRSIQVTLLRRVQILGAVRNPGLYPVDPTMTVSDALALAGGTTPQGRPDRVQLIRGGKRMDVVLSADTRIAGSPVHSGDQLYVPERSWLSRNTGVVAAAVSGTITLLVAVIR